MIMFGVLIPVALVSMACHALIPHGRHVADSQAGADWQPRTMPPHPAPVLDWQPRYVPDVLTVSDRVRQYYDAVELDVAVAIDRAIAWSRHNYELHHA